MREYTTKEVLLSNVPYAAMVALGAAAIYLGGQAAPWAGVAAAGFVVYGVAGALWIMIFMCPYCAYYASRACPCGYGVIAARLVPKGECECFAAKFKRHIPVIVPLWLIPAAVGGVALYRHFAWPLAAVLLAFAVDAYVILPLLAKSHSCGDCPQRDGCPWMGKK